MYAVITTGSKQYRVAEGDVIRIEKINANEGDTVNFENVLMVRQDDGVNIGTPYLEGVKVAARVMMHARDKKVNVLKFKRRKNYLRQYGHRQDYTAVQITAIGSECGGT